MYVLLFLYYFILYKCLRRKNMFNVMFTNDKKSLVLQEINLREYETIVKKR